MNVSQARGFIRTIRRHLWMSAVMRFCLLLLIAVSIGALPFYANENRPSDLLWAVGAMAGIAWIGLTFLSVKQLRSANQGIAYLADGRLDLAEDQLSAAALQFSLFRVGKLRACHNLAVVAHGRGKFEVAATLLDGVLPALRHPDRALDKTSRLVLADSLLSLGDSVAAAKALSPLSLQSSDLTLTEQILILPIEIRCRVATGDYESAVSDLGWKVKRAELLDSPRAAQVHALLAEACRRTGREPIAKFLTSRANLYADMQEVMADRPGLRELISSPTSADNI